MYIYEIDYLNGDTVKDEWDGGAIGMATVFGRECMETNENLAKEIRVYDTDAIINGANEGWHVWTLDDNGEFIHKIVK